MASGGACGGPKWVMACGGRRAENVYVSRKNQGFVKISL
jgi:hypothetical protein